MKKKKKIIEFLFVIVIAIGFFLYNEFNDFFYSKPEVQNKVATDNENKSSDKLEVYYLDVGQADSILIRYQNNNILIDAGNNEDGEKLVTYFKSIGIDKFQYVIGTHPHEDHIGGMDNVIDSFRVEHFFMPSVITTTKTFEDVLDSLDKNNVSLEVPKVDSSFNISDLEFRVIYIGEDATDLNNSSIVLKMNFKNTSYLFMGDATNNVEKKILDKDIKSDVLKVGHHGSQYSSSAHFLKAVSPSYAVIQCGVGNSYGHPKDVTLNKLEKINSVIYRTDLDKTIKLTSDGDNISFEKIDTDTNG